MRFICILLWLIFICGCGTGKYAERFSENTDEFEIEAAVYAHLLHERPWGEGDYTAIFLNGSDAEVKAFMRRFSNQQPPIKPSNRAELRPASTPIDRDTRKFGVILSVDALEPSDGATEAIGRWYAGEMVSGLETFVLKKAGGQWKIQSVR